LDLCGKALAIDPSYAEAHGLAAWCHFQRLSAASPDPGADLAGSLAHANAVIALRTDDASTLAFASIAYCRAMGDYETAIQMVDHALARNPSNAHALTIGSVVNGWAGRLDEAVSLAERALRCCPFDPIRQLALAQVARVWLIKGDAEVALVWARRAMRTLFPGVRLAHFMAHPTWGPFSAELKAAGLPD
jgi:adenylate cyclase